MSTGERLSGLMGILKLQSQSQSMALLCLVGEKTDKYFHCFGNGASGKGGYMYVLAESIIIIAVLKGMI